MHIKEEDILIVSMNETNNNYYFNLKFMKEERQINIYAPNPMTAIERAKKEFIREIELKMRNDNFFSDSVIIKMQEDFQKNNRKISVKKKRDVEEVYDKVPEIYQIEEFEF